MGVIVFLCSVVFVQVPFCHVQLQLPASIQKLKERLKVLQKKESPASGVTKKPLWLEFSRTSRPAKAGEVFAKSHRRKILQRESVWDFMRAGIPTVFSSLQNHADQLTHVVSGMADNGRRNRDSYCKT